MTAVDRDSAPPFRRIGIVGLGLIGGSIAMGARRRWPEARVVGVDGNAVLDQARRAQIVDAAADNLDILADADLVILAAPVVTNISLIPRLRDALTGEALITDVGSTKAAIMEAARVLPPRLIFVGGHPLAGAAQGGLGAAQPDLFHDRQWILTPAGEERDEGVQPLERFVRGLGALPKTMTAAEHDRLAGWVSHLPQLTASALMRVVGEAVGPSGLESAGSGLRDTTRLASSPANIWVDVCQTNRATIVASLTRLIAELEQLKTGLEDPTVIRDLFDAAAQWRRELTE